MQNPCRLKIKLYNKNLQPRIIVLPPYPSWFSYVQESKSALLFWFFQVKVSYTSPPPMISALWLFEKNISLFQAFPSGSMAQWSQRAEQPKPTPRLPEQVTVCDSAVPLLDSLQHQRDGWWQPATHCAVLSWVSCRGAWTMQHSQFSPQWFSMQSGWSRAEGKGICVYIERKRGMKTVDFGFSV